MANTLDAIASSDVGKFTQTVLFAAFPELFIVKTIATPILRQFIKVVSTLFDFTVIVAVLVLFVMTAYSKWSVVYIFV